MILCVVTIPVVCGARAPRWQGAGRWPGPWFPAARGRRGSGVKAGPLGPSPQAMLAALRPEGRPGMLRGARAGVSGGAGRLLGASCCAGWSGCCLSQGLVQGLGGGFPAEGLAGPGVKLRGDRVQVLAAVGGEAGAFGEVLAQQAVGVLVAAALPGRV